MYNIFEQSKKLIDKLTKKDKKEYWETNEGIEWNRNAIAPDNSEYDEEELYKIILESDRQRLLKFG